MRKVGWGARKAARVAEGREKGVRHGRRKSSVFFEIVGLAVWVFAVVVAVQLVVGYAMLWILGQEGFTEPVAQFIYTALVYLLSLGLIIFVPSGLKKKWRTSREEVGLSGWPTWQDIFLSVVGFIVATLLGALLVGIFNAAFPWFKAGEAQNVGFNTYIFGVERVVAFLALVVIAPIAEEIIFRGWLYGKLRQKLTGRVSERAGMVISILVVSALFGLIHFQWNVAVNVFALSVVLCGLREVTGTIYAGILTHMIKNGVAFYLLYVLGIG